MLITKINANVGNSGCRMPSVKMKSLNAIFRMSRQNAFYEMVAIMYMCVACMYVYIYMYKCVTHTHTHKDICSWG